MEFFLWKHVLKRAILFCGVGFCFGCGCGWLQLSHQLWLCFGLVLVFGLWVLLCLVVVVGRGAWVFLLVDVGWEVKHVGCGGGYFAVWESVSKSRELFLLPSEN